MNLRIAGESDMEPRGGFVRHSNTPLRKYRLADLDRRSCWRSFRSDCSLRSSSAMRRQCRTAKLDDFRAFQKVVWRRASHVSTSVPVFALIRRSSQHLKMAAKISSWARVFKTKARPPEWPGVFPTMQISSWYGTDLAGPRAYFVCLAPGMSQLVCSSPTQQR